MESEQDGVSDQSRHGDGLDGTAPEVVERLVRRAEGAGASDVHLQMQGATGQVWFRLDGVMVPAVELPENLAERVFGRLKFLARLKTYQESLPQEGRIAGQSLGLAHDVRVATYPTVTGEKMVLRLFSGWEGRGLAELGFPAALQQELEQCLRRQTGLLLFTGPAGSGKTTTIYACLGYLAGLGGRHIITVEDPVEQVLPGIMQTEVNEARGLDFAAAARHLLRQDPQVLVIGEIRDEETALMAVRAALSGHLLISTLHAGNCAGVLERLLLMGPDRNAVVAAVEMIVNQRLMRRVCGGCAGSGCERCLGTGYHGRVPVVEWVRLDDGRRAEMRAAGPGGLRPEQELAGMARGLVECGLTDQAELERVFGV